MLLISQSAGVLAKHSVLFARVERKRGDSGAPVKASGRFVILLRIPKCAAVLGIHGHTAVIAPAFETVHLHASAVNEKKGCPSDAAGAGEFVEALTKSMPLPRTVVVDVGLIDGRGWAVVEFNAAWGAGLKGCDAEKVLPAIVAASGSHQGTEPSE